MHRAIVWQDARTHSVIEHLLTNDYNATVQATTGLNLSAYFSAPKIAWLLENNDDVARLATQGRLRLGTIDS